MGFSKKGCGYCGRSNTKGTFRVGKAGVSLLYIRCNVFLGRFSLQGGLLIRSDKLNYDIDLNYVQRKVYCNVQKNVLSAPHIWDLVELC